MKNYLVGSLNYELIWLIYENQRDENSHNLHSSNFTTTNQSIIDYMKTNESIFL